MSECWKRHEQMRRSQKKVRPVTLKGCWIEHKGKVRVNLCS